MIGIGNCCCGGGCTGVATITARCNSVARTGVALQATNGTTTLTGITNGSGVWAPTLTASGSWTISSTDANWAGSTTVSFSCSNTSASLTLSGLNNTITAIVSKCDGFTRLDGATCELRTAVGGTLVQTVTSTNVGAGTTTPNITFTGIADGGYTIKVSQFKYKTMTSGTITVACNNGSSGTLFFGTGDDVDYFCDTCSPEPVFKNITASSWFGTVTLSRSLPGSIPWSGTAACPSGVYPDCNPASGPGGTATLYISYLNRSLSVFVFKCNDPVFGFAGRIVSDSFAAANPGDVTLTGISGCCATLCGNPPFNDCTLCNGSPLDFYCDYVLNPFLNDCTDAAVFE